jgi:8-oxo-dGTP pyrophosphatase MutT (NUDIX family)
MEEGVKREVMEETGLNVTAVHYLFSLPNVYRYSGIELPTLDMFYECDIEDETVLAANDDAAECMWIKPEDIHTEQFGLRSVRWGLVKFLEKNF